MKNYSLFKISLYWVACLYILFAVVYPYVHLHAHQTDTGTYLKVTFHPPTPCPFETHEDPDHHECHHLTHLQSHDTEFCRPRSKKPLDRLPTDEHQFNLSNNVSKLESESEGAALRYYPIEFHILPPPPQWFSNHITRGPPFIS